MGIMLLSIFVSMILGCGVWLLIGEKFPPGDDIKLPPLNNIVIYSLFLFLPVYLFIFFVIG